MALGPSGSRVGVGGRGGRRGQGGHLPGGPESGREIEESGRSGHHPPPLLLMMQQSECFQVAN